MRTIWDAVAAQARRTPLAAAVRGERNYAYQEVIERATALSVSIQAATEPGAIVALEAATPTAGAIAILAVAKSGCPVLPLSAESPSMRRAAVLSDVRPTTLVRGADEDTFTIEPVPEHDSPAAPADSGRYNMREVAYIIHTSGSTGTPKGVVISHEALLNRLDALARVPGFGPDESIVAMSTLSFDISLAEMFLPLTVGGCFVAAPAAARLDPEIFDQVVRASHPHVIQATPSFWRLALAWGWRAGTGSRLWSGGEILTPSLARRLLPVCAELWNVYGPTETTLWASAAQVITADSIDLGRPLPGGGLCLAGDDGKPVKEPRRPAEILLYGAGLALGYLNQPELTAQRFTVCETFDGPRLCYRTGDQAQYRDDGTLQFLGRTDGQIKLRGHRIELSEIEAVVEEHPAVRETAAVLRDAEDAEKAHIALFVVADAALTPRLIRGWMSDRLPATMLPGHISIQQALTRTTSGKVDRISLAKGPLE